jgi:hypothetical protein
VPTQAAMRCAMLWLERTGVAIREIARRVESAPSTVRLTTAIGGCGSEPAAAGRHDGSGLEQRVFTSACRYRRSASELGSAAISIQN